MSKAAASNAVEPPQEEKHRASSLLKRILSGLLSFWLFISKSMRRAVNVIGANPKPYEIVSATTALAADQSSLLLSSFPSENVLNVLAADQFSLSFPSLPNDIVWNILARVPRRYYPTFSCVSKSLRSLVRSSELRKTRYVQGKDDSFFVCFQKASSQTYHWFTLSQNTTGQYRLVSIPFPSQLVPHSAALMVGPEIYFAGGDINHLSRSMWILDSRSRTLRQGPSTRVARRFSAVGLVDEKIYVFGGCEDEEIQAEVFDPNTQTWEVAPNPNVDVPNIRMSVVSPSLDGKIYVKNDAQVIVYDPRDGKCEKIEIPKDGEYSEDVCVIDNVLYIYLCYVGLMWYDYKKKEWKTVNGLKLNDYSGSEVAMADYNGKLVFFREGYGRMEKKKEIWCAMVALELSWNGLDIVGKVEWSDYIPVPLGYKIMHCLGRTD